jgi:hypothetical protein
MKTFLTFLVVALGVYAQTADFGRVMKTPLIQPTVSTDPVSCTGTYYVINTSSPNSPKLWICGANAATPYLVPLASTTVSNAANTTFGNFFYDFSGVSYLKLPTNPGAPVSGCAVSGDVGKIYVRSDAAASLHSLYLCANTAASTYTWEGPYGTGSALWGNITGTISSQTDLQTALNTKLGNIVEDLSPQLGGNLDMQTFTVGGVTATQIQYLNGVASPLQAQIDGKASTTASTTVNGQTCTLGGSCTITANGGATVLTDTSGSSPSNTFTFSPSGCTALGSSDDGRLFIFQPAHSLNASGATTISYCSVSKTLLVTGGTNPDVNDIYQSTTGNPRMYQVVYHASPIDKFELMAHTRRATDSEAITGTAHGTSIDPSQAVSIVGAWAPLANVTLYKHQTARNNGTTWLNSDPVGRPSSGRTYSEWFADGTTTLAAQRMGAATKLAAANCAGGSPTATAITSSAPRLVNYAVDAGTVGHYCVVTTPSANLGVVYGGNEIVFDATVKTSLITNVNYFIGLVDVAHVDSTILSYAGGGANSPSALAGFRFSPTAGDSTSWRCTFAPSSSVAPQVQDAGATSGTITTGITHLQLRMVEGTGEYHFLIGASGGNLTEVCMSGMTGGGNMPGTMALAPYFGEYVMGGSSAPTLSIADAGIETNSVPGVTLP